MAITGGDVIELTYNHPTIGDGTFFVKSGEDTTFDPGGFRTEDDTAAVAGNGEVIKKINRVRWKVEAPIKWSMTTINELDVLRQLSTDPNDAEWTITHISGAIYHGTGTVVGDIQGDGQSATIPVMISGGGVLTEISV